MNDNLTNHPRDHTCAPGGTFPEVKDVADTFIFMLQSHQVITADEIERIVNLVSQTCFLLGLKAGEANAYREIALKQAEATRQPDAPHLHIVNASKAEINESASLADDSQ